MNDDILEDLTLDDDRYRIVYVMYYLLEVTYCGLINTG